MRISTARSMNKLIAIEGQVQPYLWGGLDYLPALLQYDNKDRQPQAEYWLGVHPAAPAQTLDNGQPLAIRLSEHGCQLAFLLKILDVRQMLSIQVHPSKAEAEAGFARENDLGIALTAKNRNYKDTNHKPELMVALSEFWLLHGFMANAKIAERLASKAYLLPLLERLQTQGLRAAFELALDGDNPLIARINQSLLADMSQAPTLSDKTNIDFWIQRWLAQNPGVVNGLLTLYFMNLVKAEAGQALYQPAGLLHAYLEGQNVELMADSDNVLRAGLTPKHIDVKELLNVCMVKPSDPQDYIIEPEQVASGEQRFPTPFEQFELRMLNGDNKTRFTWHSSGVEIILCLSGSAELQEAEQRLSIHQGQALAVLPGAEVTLVTTSPDTQLYKAINLGA